MPSKPTFQVYYDLLMQQLTQGSREPVDLSAQNMANAIQEVNRQINAQAPNPNRLDRSFNTFCDSQEHPQRYRPLKADSYTMPNGTSRYDYAGQCRQEVMKNVEYRVRQTLEWRTATQRLGLVNQDGTIKNVSYGRWISYLMKTDDSEQSRRYNESVVALTALVRGNIQKDEYLRLREAHHIKYDNMSQEEAKQNAQEDFDNRAEFLYSEVNNAIEAGRGKIARFKDASLAIQTGDFSKFDGSMEAAFDVFQTNAVNLAMIGLDMFADLRRFGLNRTPEQEQEITLRWQDYAMEANGLQNVADQVSNPYFAVFDPQKYYVYGTTQTMIPNDVPENSLAFSFMNDGISYSTVAGKELNQALKPFALDAGREITADRTKDFRVFQQEDRTIILKVGGTSPDHILSADNNVPGQMISQDFETRVQALTERCAGWSKKHRTSREFENMRESLTALSRLRLDQNPTQEQINAVAVGFEELRADAQAYLDRKLRQRPDQAWDGSYERNRVSFASDVLEFAEQKLRQVRYYNQHNETEAMRHLADIEDWADPAWRNDPRYAEMSPLEHKVAVNQEAVRAEQAARAEAQRQQRAEAERAQREAENAYRVADGTRSAAAYDRLFQGLGADAGDPVNAGIQVEAFVAGHKATYDNHAGTIRNATIFQDEGWRQEVQNADLAMFGEAKYIIAGYTIAELLNAERVAEADHQRKGLPGNVDTPIRKLVNAGKTQELAEAIMSSSHFQGQFALRLSNPAEMEKLFNGRTTGDKPTRRECYLAGKDFLNNMALAKQQQAEQQNQQADQPEDEEEIRQEEKGKIQEDEKENNPEDEKEIQEDEKDNLEDEKEIQKEEKENNLEDEKEIQEDKKEHNPKDEEKIQEDEKENNLEDEDGNDLEDEEEIQEDEKENNLKDKEEIQEDEKENHLEEEDELESEDEEDSLSESSEEEEDSLSESSEEELRPAPKKDTDEPGWFNQELGNCFQYAQTKKTEGLASDLLNQRISSPIKSYMYMKKRNNPSLQDAMMDQAQDALSSATLKYMVEQDSTGVLANAVEKEQSYWLTTLIRDSSAFQERFKDFSLEQLNAAVENNELFCKPVGDALLAMGKDAITTGGQQREQQQRDSEELNKALGKALSIAQSSEQTDWAKAEQEPYSRPPAQTYLNKENKYHTDLFSVFAGSQDYASDSARNSAKQALAISTLQYMMEADPTRMVLENVVERNQYGMLRDMILESRLFEKEFDKLDPKDSQQLDKALSHPKLFAKPVGDQILSMVEDSLVNAAPQVAEQKKKDYFHGIRDKVEAHVKGSEAAQKSGNTALAEQQGRDALALQSASALLIYTNEEGKLPKRSVSALTEKVKASEVFRSALKTVDLKNPKELRGAISQNFGKTVAESILTAEKQKGMKKPLGGKKMEKSSQQKVIG